jgi:hypothetical protein
MISFTAYPLCPWERDPPPLYLQYRRHGGTQGQYGCCVEDKCCLPCLGNEPQFFGHRACALSLYRLTDPSGDENTMILTAQNNIFHSTRINIFRTVNILTVVL